MRSGVTPSSSDQAKRKVAPSARITRYPTKDTTESAKRYRSENRRSRASTVLLEGAGSTGLIVLAGTGQAAHHPLSRRTLLQHLSFLSAAKNPHAPQSACSLPDFSLGRRAVRKSGAVKQGQECRDSSRRSKMTGLRIVTGTRRVTG